MEITCVTIDSHEPTRLAEFWNAALGWGGVAVSPDGGGAVCGPPDGGLFLEFDPAVAENYRNLVLRDPEGNEFCLGGGEMAG